MKGINYDATEDDLRSAFSKYGEVTSCRILKDKETKKSKGIGFVNFAEKKSAECALDDADNLVVKGRNVQVRYANDKEGEFKGRKGAPMNKDDGSHNQNRGNNDRGRGFRGRGRGRGGFRGNNRGDNRDNNRGSNWGNNKEDNNEENNAWGSNDRERSRSKENNNESSW